MSGAFNTPYLNTIKNEVSLLGNIALDGSNFGVLCLNIRGLACHWAEFLTLLGGMKQPPKCILLCETWLNKNNFKLYDIKNYSSYHLFRESKKGGGISIYIHTSLKVNQELNSSILNDNIELLSKTVSMGRCDLELFSVYRPPRGCPNQFTEQLCKELDSRDNKKVLIGGDTNIDILKLFKNNTSSNFCTELTSRGFLLCNNQITRPNLNKLENSTLIDHVWTNMDLVNPKSYTIQYSITDHFPILLYFETRKHFKTVHSVVERRVFSTENINTLRNEILNTNWNDLMKSNDINELYSSFNEKLCELYERHIPVTRKTIKIYDHVSPWMTDNVKHRIKQKQINFKLFKQGLISQQYYRSFCRKTENLVRRAKSDYHRRKLRDAADSSDRWKHLKSIIGVDSQTKVPINTVMADSGQEISNTLQIANTFNEYFANVGPITAGSIPQSDISFDSSMGSPSHHGFRFFDCQPQEVEAAISKMKNKKSNSTEIPVHLYKDLKRELSTPLSALITKSFRCGSFPDELKIANVVPIHKAGDPKQVSNYRPISILPTLSKLFEKIVHKRLYKFLTKFNILHKSQFGFRSGHSTIDALSLILHKIHTSLEAGKVAMNIYLDLSKAFDTVNHNLLLSKLDHYGVRGVEQSWFRSYLSNRKQTVKIEKTQGAYKDITVGVPQGSILGPLLFTIMINDLFRVTEIPVICYADDSTVVAAAQTPEELVSLVNRTMQDISQWMCANKLKLNVQKTKYSCFTKKRFLTMPDPTIGGMKIERSCKFKILGVTLDENLNYAGHINKIISKLAYLSHIVYKANSNMVQQDRTTIYNAYVKPVLTYGSTIWGSTNKKYRRKIQTLQNRIVRKLLPQNLSTQQKFDKLKIMNILQLHTYEIALYMHGVFHERCPQSITQIMEPRPSHDYQIRAHNLRKPKIRLTASTRMITFLGPSIWNEIPNDIKHLPRPAFRRHVANLIFENRLG